MPAMKSGSSTLSYCLVIFTSNTRKMSQRIGLRLLRASQSPALRTSFRQPLLRRNVQTAGVPTVDAPATNQSALQKLWNSPVGPKTVHFWAPIMKWGLVLAGIADLFRPAEKLSLTQNLALMGTGAIWTRWCLIIKPKNIFLATVNFFLFCVGTTQVSRIMFWRSSQKDTPAGHELKEAAKEQGQVLEGVLQDPVGSAKQAVGK